MVRIPAVIAIVAVVVIVTVSGDGRLGDVSPKSRTLGRLKRSSLIAVGADQGVVVGVDVGMGVGVGRVCFSFKLLPAMPVENSHVPPHGLVKVKVFG